MTPTERKSLAALRESHAELVDALASVERAIPGLPWKAYDGVHIILRHAEIHAVKSALATARKLTEEPL